MAYNHAMNWKKIITEIQAAGYYQQQIADEVGCVQSTIHFLLKGKTPEPFYELGARILAMHQRVTGKTAQDND